MNEAHIYAALIGQRIFNSNNYVFLFFQKTKYDIPSSYDLDGNHGKNK